MNWKVIGFLLELFLHVPYSCHLASFSRCQCNVWQKMGKHVNVETPIQHPNFTIHQKPESLTHKTLFGIFVAKIWNFCDANNILVYCISVSCCCCICVSCFDETISIQLFFVFARSWINLQHQNFVIY
jgi:hypothetical protein